jgi:hypothetical protein
LVMTVPSALVIDIMRGSNLVESAAAKMTWK